jgi:N-acetylmuramoyl-L-alanine amidase
MTPYVGLSILGGDGWRQAQKWAETKGAPDFFLENAKKYWLYGHAIGIRPELAYAQHAKETNFGRFGGVLDETFHNCAGIKIRAGGGDYDPNAHERFPDWDTGVMAHYNHLSAYIFGKGGPTLGTPHERYYLVLTTSWAGTIKTAEQMNARWAPSKTYGDDLVRYFLTPLLESKIDSYEDLAAKLDAIKNILL